MCDKILNENPSNVLYIYEDYNGCNDFTCIKLRKILEHDSGNDLSFSPSEALLVSEYLKNSAHEVLKKMMVSNDKSRSNDSKNSAF